MIRTYYLTYEGDKDQILEQHGMIMKQLRNMGKRNLDHTISFDEKRMLGRELWHSGKRGMVEGAGLAMEGAKKGLKALMKGEI